MEFILVDRERFQAMYFQPLPHTYLEDTDLDMVLDVAFLNMTIAMEQVHTVMNLRRHYKSVEQARKKMSPMDGRAHVGNQD